MARAENALTPEPELAVDPDAVPEAGARKSESNLPHPTLVGKRPHVHGTGGEGLRLHELASAQPKVIMGCRSKAARHRLAEAQRRDGVHRPCDAPDKVWPLRR